MKQHFTKLFFAAFMPLAAYGQTIVSTTPENRKVIMEEFTGIYCQYCPDGHAIANQIISNNPGNAFVINIHQGGFSTPSGNAPDFRTPFGNALAAQTITGNSIGYPIATVNRHLFQPSWQMYGGTGMGRGYWAPAANLIVDMPSYVNVGTNATASVNGRTLTVNVEAYYTDDSPESTNFLNVALLQNNTKGPQTAGGQGNNYNHMHRLVHLVTGQWGEEITTTTQGTLVTKTYTYEIPAFYNNVFADINELEVVAFVTETRQEIISGNGAPVEVVPSIYSNDLNIAQVDPVAPICIAEINPTFIMMNEGNSAVTSANITYSINEGEEQIYNWTGNLALGEYAIVELDIDGFEILDTNTLTISVESDENNANNSKTITFEKSVESKRNLTLNLRTDAYGNECRWNIKNSAGETIQQGQGYGANQNHTIEIALPEEDCYTFNLIDTYGDGGAPISLVDIDGTTIFSTTGDYGAGASINFGARGPLGISDVALTSVNIYPNPSTGIVNISAKSDKSQIEVFDLTGKRVMTIENAEKLSTIDLSKYGKGTFVIKINDGNSVTTKKVIIK